MVEDTVITQDKDTLKNHLYDSGLLLP